MASGELRFPSRDESDVGPEMIRIGNARLKPLDISDLPAGEEGRRRRSRWGVKFSKWHFHWFFGELP